ncbi:MAG: DUF4158 domain-containing protein [Solirubrobacteraceae bacterium]
MTSIERTAYPRFGRVVPAQELDGLSPLPDEVECAMERSRSEGHLLGLLVALECFQRLGHFPREDQVPGVIVERVRGCLGLPDAAGWEKGAAHRGVAASAGSRSWALYWIRLGRGRWLSRRSGSRRR